MSKRPRTVQAPAVRGERNVIANDRVPEVVLRCIDDPARLAPMMAGASRVRGGRITVRTAGEDIEIDAPAPLLSQVFDVCDGTRTVQDILGGIASAAARSEFEEFLGFLLAQGALIDASLAGAHAARYALQNSPFGFSADTSTTGQVCRRFFWNREGGSRAAPSDAVTLTDLPLADCFGKRVSTYTFNDRPVAEPGLHKLLWSIAGIVSDTHPRIGQVAPQRTLASAGGMHLLEVYVALKRAVGRHEPGVYRVRYPGEHALWLEKVSDSGASLPRAFAKPWELTFATGAIFLAANPAVAAMRYRSRSMQYLFMEAGAALQNGGLAAARLAIGYATIGGYYEAVVERLCALQGQWVLGSAIFGAQPTAEQLALVDRAPDLTFAWIDGESPRFSIGCHLARATLKVAGEERLPTWGRGTDPWLAMQKAIGEAVEREGFREPRSIVEGTAQAVDGAVDPRELVRYSDAQYASPGFPYHRFDPATSYPWASATDMSTGASKRVLAEFVYSRASLAAQGHLTPRPYTQVTSSGCAAGLSFNDAVHRALLEVIERDAFMRHWLAQEPGDLVDPARLPESLRRRLSALERAGCRVSVQRLKSAWAHVALIGVQHAELGFTTLSTAAGAHLLATLANAVEEVEPRVYVWLNGHAPAVMRPELVDSTEHHFDLYGSRRYFRRADRLLFPGVEPQGVPSRRKLPVETSDQLLGVLISKGLRPLVADITPRRCHVDQGRTRLWAVKALIPGLLPMSFGYQREPLGMATRIHPGSKFPHPFP